MSDTIEDRARKWLGAIWQDSDIDEIVAYIMTEVERERELCAKLADENCDTVTHQCCGDAIRARGAK